MGAGPSRLVGHHVLAYVCEHAYVTRSKTPVVDAFLVLYPAFAAALTLHQVKVFCAQELCELSDKALPLQVHYMYSRWHTCGERMLKRRAVDAELDRSGVPACALWVCALVTANATCICIRCGTTLVDLSMCNAEHVAECACLLPISCAAAYQACRAHGG